MFIVTGLSLLLLLYVGFGEGKLLLQILCAGQQVVERRRHGSLHSLAIGFNRRTVWRADSRAAKVSHSEPGTLISR